MVILLIFERGESALLLFFYCIKVGLINFNNNIILAIFAHILHFMKNSEIVSIVINQLKYTNKDEHISRRFVLRKLRENARNLISQKLRDRSLYREDPLESWIKCLEMERVDSVKCDIVEFKNCKDLMVSVKELPEVIYSRYGAGLSKAYSIDGEKEYEYTTLRQYNLNKKRRQVNNKYFYIKDNRLYLPDSTVERVDIPLITLETEKIPEINSCDNSTDCRSIWEYEFIGSDRFLQNVIGMVIQELAQTHRQIVEDANPDMDPNIKSSTTR